MSGERLRSYEISPAGIKAVARGGSKVNKRLAEAKTNGLSRIGCLSQNAISKRINRLKHRTAN